MEQSDWLQLFLFLLTLIALSKPIGLYLFNVLDPQGKTGLESLLKPLEKLTYRFCKIDPEEQQDWKQYTSSLFLFSLFGFLFTFAILLFQSKLPLNPQHLDSLNLIGVINAAISFVSNTDWESFPPEKTLSYFSTMFALTAQNFCSAGVGICVAAALARGIANQVTRSLGNFWVDIIRVCYYLLLPLSLLLSVIFISEGVPQNFKPFSKIFTVEGEKVQHIVQGPIASLESIKLLGSNGGSPTQANSSHPYENPTPLSNWLQMISIMLIPVGQIYFFGKMIQNQKHAWSIFAFMTMLFCIGLFVSTYFESNGNPIFSEMSFDLSGGNMEGKEQRFGIFNSTLFSTATTTVSNGAMNSMHSSYMPWSQFMILQNMQIGNEIFGGVGTGIYSIVTLILVAVFIAGLIIGKVPQYLGKKIESFEIKMCMMPLIIYICGILGLTGVTFIINSGLEQIGHSGPHGFTEVLYIFSSTLSNNGSDYGTLHIESNYFNIATSFAMLLGRYLVILPTMALAGSLSQKKKHLEGQGFFPIQGITFIFLLIFIFIAINALAYLPSLLLGPVYEQIHLNLRSLF